MNALALSLADNELWIVRETSREKSGKYECLRRPEERGRIETEREGYAT